MEVLNNILFGKHFCNRQSINAWVSLRTVSESRILSRFRSLTIETLLYARRLCGTSFYWHTKIGVTL